MAVVRRRCQRGPRAWCVGGKNGFSDGAMEADSHAGLQLMFDVAWLVARLMGLTIGVNAKGTKTAWTGGEWQRTADGRKEWRACGAEREIWLPGGPEGPIQVPYVTSYKHLGTLMGATVDHSAVRKRVATRCRSLLGMLARLGVLSAAQYERAGRAVVDSLLGYYGRATPFDDATCEEIEVARRRGLRVLGHWPRGIPMHMVYARDGLGSSHARAAAAAALHDEFDRALTAPEGRPVRTTMEAAILQTFFWDFD